MNDCKSIELEWLNYIDANRNIGFHNHAPLWSVISINVCSFLEQWSILIQIYLIAYISAGEKLSKQNTSF